ncbi:MAG: hypothetical protein ACU0BS_05290 [Hasllibacter sp.]
MTDTMKKLGASALVLALLGACAPGGMPMSDRQEINDPTFSGVTNTDAADGSFTPDSSAL